MTVGDNQSHKFKTLPIHASNSCIGKILSWQIQWQLMQLFQRVKALVQRGEKYQKNVEIGNHVLLSKLFFIGKRFWGKTIHHNYLHHAIPFLYYSPPLIHLNIMIHHSAIITLYFYHLRLLGYRNKRSTDPHLMHIGLYSWS